MHIQTTYYTQHLILYLIATSLLIILHTQQLTKINSFHQSSRRYSAGGVCSLTHPRPITFSPRTVLWNHKSCFKIESYQSIYGINMKIFMLMFFEPRNPLEPFSKLSDEKYCHILDGRGARFTNIPIIYVCSIHSGTEGVLSNKKQKSIKVGRV